MHKVGAHFLRFPEDPEMWIPTEDEVRKTHETIKYVRKMTRSTDINDYPCTCGGRCEKDFIFENGAQHNTKT